MPRNTAAFFLLACALSLFLSYGCKSAQVKPSPAPLPQVTVKAEAPPEAPKPAPPKPTEKVTPPPPPTTVPPPQPPAPPKRGDVSFNFDDADVYSVIQTILGDVLRVNYVIDPSVKGKVTFRSVAPVAKDDVLPLMEVILRLNGIGIVEEGGLYRIVPIADIAREPAPVGMGREPGAVHITGKAIVQVVPIRFIQSSEMVRVLTPFLSKNAVIVDVPKGNYIVIVDTDANVKRLLELVDVFDNEKLKAVTPKVFVYSVQNGKAKDVASILQQVFQGKGAGTTPSKTTTSSSTPTKPPIPGQPPQTAAPAQPTISMGGAPGETALVSEVTRIIPDDVTNSIIILATPEDFNLIADTIQKIDIPPRQVIIEGLIVQVTLQDNLNFGMSYLMNSGFSISGLKPFMNPINLNGGYNVTTGQLNSSVVSVNPGGLDLTKLPSNGFTFVGYDPTGTIRAVLTALEDRSKAKVVAAPHVIVSDNREARIQIGQQIPIATSTSSSIGSTATTTTTGETVVNPVIGTSTIQYKDIGIILKVKPQVNDSGLISLELSQEISSVGSSVNVGGLAEITINKTEATSNLVARDGDTVIIGGLIREDTSHETAGIPLLSRIPILGSLFGSTSNTTTRTELILLLTPHVIRNQREASEFTTDYIDRYKKTTNDREIDKFIKTKQENGKPKNSP